MSPLLALLLTVALIFYLFARDLGQQSDASLALWIPWLWMLIIGSRFVSEWINLGSPIQVTADSIEEGSPIDRMIFLLLISSGFYCLWKRKISWPLLLQRNSGLFLYICYCAVSILWSDFPLIAFKRLIKVLGHPLMAMLLLTERDPVNAVETVIKRCAYVLIPLSVLFVKYYPNIGRGYARWTYEPIVVGVTNNKNLLGMICMFFGLFFICKFLSLFGQNRVTGKITEGIITFFFLCMILWLLYVARSGTSLVCFIIASCVAWCLGASFLKKYLKTSICIALAIILILQLTFNITESIILSLGKDMTLTDRTEIWPIVIQLNPNSLIGTGFESFWLGERLETMWGKYWWQPNQAHNGYVETYINLGWLGVFFLFWAILSSFQNIQKVLIHSLKSGESSASNFDFGKFRMGFLAALIAYNITEATFKAVHFLYFIFFVIAIEYPHVKSTIVTSNSFGLPRTIFRCQTLLLFLWYHAKRHNQQK